VIVLPQQLRFICVLISPRCHGPVVRMLLFCPQILWSVFCTSSLIQQTQSVSSMNSAVYRKSDYQEPSEYPVVKQVVDATRRILARPAERHPRRPTGLLVRTMRYFRASDIFGAKVYFKGWRAPGHFFLPNEFQNCRNPFRWLARKIFFLANQRGDLAG